MDLDRDAFYRAFRTRDARLDGRVFAGVLTTGIYCRPICPARTPKRENVVFFVSAAAAQEAGFRPCLRCRPETSPDVGAWQGSSNTVARALSLIEDGALDGGDVESLAERLGIGGRQLRRLFKAHLGASPLTVAQTRRIHLAKQLVHDTTLSMSDVAMASGFGSVRRFNETFQRLFGRPPRLLRRSRSVTTTAPGAAITLRLPYAEPYDFDALLDFLRARAIPGVESVDRRRYARTVTCGGVHGTLSVEADRAGQLRLTVRLPKLTGLPSLIARARRMFDLATDPRAIAEHLSTDPLLAPMVQRRPGLRIPGAWDGFELAVRAILGQQVTVSAATRLVEKVVELAGERIVTNEPGLFRAFPAPAGVANADLTTLGVPRARARAVTALAEAAARDGHLFVAGRDLDAAVGHLRGLPGVGEWTAQYVVMRELREPDAFPAMDAGIRRALSAVTGAPVSSAKALKRAEAWRPWRAYAAAHLWASLTDASAEVSPKRRVEMKNTLPERYTLDCITTPIGVAHFATDADGALVAFVWADSEERFCTWLELHGVHRGALARGGAPAGVRDALERYFAGDVGAIDGLPCTMRGTPFQRAVWTALRSIPAGATMTYGELATRIGAPGASRAVGLANNRNPIGLVVPCHRVIGANGALTGYAGGLERKRWLLEHESSAAQPRMVSTARASSTSSGDSFSMRAVSAR